MIDAGARLREVVSHRKSVGNPMQALGILADQHMPDTFEWFSDKVDTFRWGNVCGRIFDLSVSHGSIAQQQSDECK